MNTDGQHQRDRQRHDRAGANAEAEQADAQHDGNGLPQGLHEFVDCVLDGQRLVGDQHGLDADRQVLRDSRHGFGDVVSKGHDVAALAHGDGDADALLAVDAEHRLRRIGGPARNLGDVAQTDDAASGDEVDVKNILL